MTFPDQVYINELAAEAFSERLSDAQAIYVRAGIAYGYASEVERLRDLLKEYARHKIYCQRYGRLQCTCGFAETMARDALTKEG